jgi:proteasome lid subunit RPN8/RPN11
MKNVDASPVTYRLDAGEQFRVFNEIEDEGLDLWAFYHSHTHSEAYPSETDVRLAFFPEARYLLVTLADREAPVLRAFWIRDGQVDEEELTIT